jgi:hypothetical protein
MWQGYSDVQPFQESNSVRKLPVIAVVDSTGWQPCHGNQYRNKKNQILMKDGFAHLRSVCFINAILLPLSAFQSRLSRSSMTLNSRWHFSFQLFPKVSSPASFSLLLSRTAGDIMKYSINYRVWRGSREFCWAF